MPTLICAATRVDCERVAKARGLGPTEWQRLSNEHQLQSGETFRVIIDPSSHLLPEYSRIQYALNMLHHGGTLHYV